MLGLTSITFRSLSVEDIIDLTGQAGLDGIEWGGDVHVPPGDPLRAHNVAARTEAAGLRTLSYGSYFRLCQSESWRDDWAAVLETAAALHAPRVRIWAGERGSAQATDEYAEQAIRQLRACCEEAAFRGLAVGLEYHRGTLTDTWQSTRRLLDAVSAPNLTTYWQPNPDLTQAQRLEEIERLQGHISTLHVFRWTQGNMRHPLAEGAAEWQDYFALLSPARHDCILEFVRNDMPAQLLKDARALRDMTDAARA